MSLLRRLAVLLTSTGFLSCGAAPLDWQSIQLPALGELRLRHPHVLVASDTKAAEATARTLIEWTRDHAWDPLRVKVTGSHPLVVKLKAGALLVLTPDDASLPIIWFSLEPGQNQALLENRSTGGLAIYAVPTGKTLNLAWLTP